MGLAHYASLRSHDSETKVGCVIVNHDNHVLSIGYNGFPAGCRDDELPSTRPLKYPFMVHAEENAISNLTVNAGKGLRAYITHTPCYRCAKLLWQNSVRHWHIEKGEKAKSFSEKDNIVYAFLLDNGLKVGIIKTEKDIFIDLSNKIDSGFK